MDRIYLNNDWLFSFSSDESYEPVRIPHTVKETSFNYFSEEEYQTVSTYERIIFADEAWRGSVALLSFDGVAHYAEVFLNGEKIGEHYSGYTAFTIDISDKLSYGEENKLSVRVDSRENLNIPPFGHVIDYMTYGGIYRDVYLDIKPSTYISDVFVKAKANGEIDSDIEIKGSIHKSMTVEQSVVIGGVEYMLGRVNAGEKLSISSLVQGALPWSVDHPNLYTVKTELIYRGEIIDTYETRTGFRDAEFRADGFYLNGKKLKIRGLNRHQSYPYVGYAMPKSIQEMDADVLKYELGLNAVRTSHYPQSQHFINRCDEIGLMVLTEMPGWQYIGDESWQAQAVKNVEEMVIQYRNHPSIILWGVRINESPDNETLYTKTNEAAHRLDSTRHTGGIRNFRHSQFLEDVYTYNDFVHDGKKPGCMPKAKITSDDSKPYIITEYCGHMFPTKTFDCEEHRLEHALRHARVLNAVASHSDICGSFGWCMADYNTHKDFGSGDRVCYHGVTDMFRNPKLAAAVYASQADATVLEVSSSMDIGEHPACIKGDIWAFSNADSLRVYKNDSFVSEYSPVSNKRFRYLGYSPILIDDFIGDTLEKGENLKPRQAKLLKSILNYIARNGYSSFPLGILIKAAQCMLFYGMKYNDIVDLYNEYAGDWGGKSTVYRFEAVKNGKVVKTVVKTPMKKSSLCAEAYRTELIDGDSYDVGAIRIKAVDENGNTLIYATESVTISTEGPIEIIGPSVVSLRGGMAGVYVKSVGRGGDAVVTLHSQSLGDLSLSFKVN